jgi:putative SOS response-associated peptidase YedK
MCYWVGTKNVREEIQRRRGEDPSNEIAQLFYDTFLKDDPQLVFREYYVAIGKSNPRLSVLLFDDSKGLHFSDMKWGLDWSYTNSKTGKQYSRQLINSTSEKVFFVHKDVIFKQRCVIPLDGYYEFFHFAGQVYPHFIHPLVAEGLFYVAGVWQESIDTETGEISTGFSIITTPPNPLAEKLHNNPKAPNGPRMLLILPDNRVLDYLDPKASKDDLQNLFGPFPESKMDAYPTVRFLKKEFSGSIASPDVRKRVDYPELAFA